MRANGGNGSYVRGVRGVLGKTLTRHLLRVSSRRAHCTSLSHLGLTLGGFIRSHGLA